MSDRSEGGEPMSDSEIEAERIAALLDGRVDGEERAELLRRLATSRCFREIAETAAVLRELEEPTVQAERVRDAVPGPPHDPIIHPVEPGGAPPSAVRGRTWRRRSTRWLPLASVVALVLVVPLVWRTASEGVDVGTPASHLASRDEGLPAGWTATRPWPVTLGAGEALSPTARAVRAGVLHTDLLLATRGGDTVQATRLRAEMAALISGVEGAAGAVRAYGGTVPESEQTLASAGGALEQLLGSDEVRWGAWLEAARIAAARRDAAFFRTHQSRAALEHATRYRHLPAAARATARRVNEALEAGTPPDWAAVADDFDQLLAASAI